MSFFEGQNFVSRWNLVPRGTPSERDVLTGHSFLGKGSLVDYDSSNQMKYFNPRWIWVEVQT